jgi:hypothetical protein
MAPNPDELRAFADEAVNWAKTARSDQERAIFLQMMRTWLDAGVAAERQQGRSLRHETLPREGPMDAMEAAIGVRNPDAFEKTLRTYEGEPRNNTALAELLISNKSILDTDQTGERFERLLKFIYSAGGPNRIGNVVEFMRRNSKTMPERARAIQRPLTDQYFKEYWASIEAL